MKIDASAKCTPKEACDTYSPIPLQTDKTVLVEKTNTLHQFDTEEIVGIQSPVGKIPLVFRIKDGPNRGRRGILYYGNRDTVCWMYPESEHAEWCKQPYDMKYDALEPFNNGVERGLRRNHGIFELWVSILRKWYNGQIMYRPSKRIQGCGHEDDGYPSKSTVEVVEEKVIKRSNRIVPPVKRKSRGCGCRKGV